MGTSMTDKTRRAHFFAFLALMIACGFVVARMAAPYLLALFLGGMLAMLGNGTNRRLLARGARPAAAAWLTTTLMALMLVLPAAGFSTMAVREGLAAGRALAAKNLSTDGVKKALESSEPVKNFVGDRRAIEERLREWSRDAERLAGDAALSLTKAVPLFLLQIALALVSCYFFLLDGERLARRLLALTALDRDVQEALLTSFRDTAVSAVLAGLAAAASQAACITAGYAALGVPRPFLAGAATFVLAWVPVVGSLPASAAGLVYLYFEGTPWRMAAMAALAVFVGIVDNLVRPVVLKGRDEMHPLVGLLAVIGGIDMFGILGLFLGPILAATLIELLDLWPEIGVRYGLDLDGRREGAIPQRGSYAASMGRRRGTP
jgi:predicted PurR-regulated permease PerM